MHDRTAEPQTADPSGFDSARVHLFRSPAAPQQAGSRIETPAETALRATALGLATMLGTSKVIGVDGLRHRRSHREGTNECVVDFSKAGPAEVVRSLSTHRDAELREQTLSELVFGAVRRSERAALASMDAPASGDVVVGRWLEEGLRVASDRTRVDITRRWMALARAARGYELLEREERGRLKLVIRPWR